MGGSGSSVCGKAWPVGSGRTSYWPCWVNSSWWGRRSVALLSLYASRYSTTTTAAAVLKQHHGGLLPPARHTPGKLNIMSVHQEDILSIWNRTSNDQMTTSRIRDTLRRVLNLPTNTIMEYKTHNDSLRYGAHRTPVRLEYTIVYVSVYMWCSTLNMDMNIVLCVAVKLRECCIDCTHAAS